MSGRKGERSWTGADGRRDGAAATVKVTAAADGGHPGAATERHGPASERHGGKVPVVAVSVTLPLPVPPAVESVNQGALSLAVHVRVPPPVLLIVRVCGAGFAPP